MSWDQCVHMLNHFKLSNNRSFLLNLLLHAYLINKLRVQGQEILLQIHYKLMEQNLHYILLYTLHLVYINLLQITTTITITSLHLHHLLTIPYYFHFLSPPSLTFLLSHLLLTPIPTLFHSPLPALPLITTASTSSPSSSFLFHFVIWFPLSPPTPPPTSAYLGYHPDCPYPPCSSDHSSWATHSHSNTPYTVLWISTLSYSIVHSLVYRCLVGRVRRPHHRRDGSCPPHSAHSGSSTFVNPFSVLLIFEDVVILVVAGEGVIVILHLTLVVFCHLKLMFVGNLII